MAISSIIKQTCTQCGKIAVEKSRISLGSSKIITLECGHLTTEDIMSSVGAMHILNNTTLRPYQVAGVEFLERANGRALIADAIGLGKTIQVLAFIKLHKEDLLPAVIVSPTSATEQWHHEIRTKCGIHGFLTQVLNSGKVMAAPGFDIYITTYDLLKKDEAFALVKDKIKFIVLDECQRIKNHLSERAKAVQRFCKGMEHITPLSGTPI